MTNGTTDAFTALADELGRIGRRLDGMGTELLALRGAVGTEAGSAAAVAGPEAASSADPPPGAPPSGHGAPLPVMPAPGDPAPRVPVPGAAGPGAVPRPVPASPAWSPWVAPAGTGAPGPGAAAYPPAAHGPYGAPPPWPAGPPAPGAPGPGGRGWAPGAGYPAPPAGGPGGPLRPGPVPPAPPRRSSALTGARLLAWTGGAVTLLGVVLLLVLAASRGWLNAPTGLTLAGVLGAVLVGLALRLHRKESARTGAFALAATGFADLYLTVAAATSLYDYLLPAVAIPLAVVIAGAGLGVADRWRSVLLAGGVTVGGALLAPALADGWLLVALALALQLAALPVVLRRGWSVLLVLAAAGPALYGVGLVDESRVVVVVALAVAALAIGVASAFLARTTADGARAAVVVAAALPAIAGAGGLRDARGWILALGVAVALGALAFLPERSRAVRVATAATAIAALLEATVLGLDGSWVTVAVLGQALAAAGVATALRSRFAVVVGLVLGAWGFLAAIGRDAPLLALLRFDTAPYLLDGTARIADLVTGVAVSLLVLAVATVLLLATGRLGWTRPDSTSAVVWVPLGLVGLYGAASLVMAVAMLISPTQAGFTAGHAVITVSWAVAALVLLARGLSRPALRIAGLVLVAAAVAKLFLFDLVALDGLARVVAFLGAGLVMLAAGTRYARLVAEAETAGPEKAGVPPSG